MGHVSAAIEPCAVARGDSMVRGFKIVCGKCGAVHKTNCNTSQSIGRDSDVTHRRVEAKLETMGWKIGSTVAGNRCPSCNSRRKQMALLHIRQKEEETVGEAVPLKTKAELRNTVSGQTITTVRQSDPARADRRVIFAKLEEVYGDETIGYKPGWSDEKVATDLGVPLAWVTELREQNFGPNVSAELVALAIETNAFTAAANKLFNAINTFRTEITRLHEEGQRLHERGADIQRRLDAALPKPPTT